MWQVMVYAIAVAAALSLMGFCDEKLSNMLDRPRRYFWVSTMLLSLAWPVTMLLWLRPAAELAPPIQAVLVETLPASRVLPLAPDGADAMQGGITQLEARASASATADAAAPATPNASASMQSVATKRWKAPSDRTVLLAWAAASSLVLLGLASADLLLQRRASRWQRATVLGREVLLSEATGPALLGVWRPRIVVPRWFLDEPAEVQSLILAHEQQHIAARDPLLLRLALCVVVAVPWNLPLWWQLRRLRLCIELDCDARVLRGGAQAAAYGEVLLAVTQRAGNVPMGVVAMGEPTSALERRIRHLTPDPARHSVLRASIALLVWGASIGLAGVPRVPAIPVGRAEPVLVATRVHAESLPAIPVAAASMAPTTAAPDAPASPQGMAAAQAPLPDGGVARADPVALPRLPLPIAVSTEVARVLRPSAPEITTPDATVPDEVLRALLQQYPEVAVAGTLPGPYGVELILRADGSIHGSRSRDANVPSTQVVPPFLVTPDMGVRHTAILRPGTALPDGSRLRGLVMLSYMVLADGYDASRSRESTGALVLAAHPEWLSPTDGNTMNRVTAFLTVDGKLDRFYVESLARGDQIPYFDDTAPGGIVPELMARNWERLGLQPQQLGQMGLHYARAGTAESGRDLLLRYAWPRRAGEPLGGTMPNDGFALRVSFTHADVAAVLGHHLPGALSQKGSTPAGVPWLLLSQQGEVVKSGYVAGPVPPGNPSPLIEAANPGMRVAYGMQVAGRAGQPWAGRVILAWLPPAR